MPTEPSRDALRASGELRSLVGRLRRRMRELRSAEDIAPGALAVMLRLHNDGPATAAVLAAGERIRPQSMATKLAELERDGLVSRRPDPSDGRRLLVDLTEDGRRRFEGDRAARREWLARALQERYTDEERAHLLEALDLLERLVED